MTEKQELRALTGLRFVAAFYVFLFHWHSAWPITTNKLLGNLLSQGAIGMSIFFVLSGFVLAYQYQDGTRSQRDYFISRLARIYPIYLVAAIITLPLFGVSTEDSFLRGVGQGALLVFANVFLIQAWFPQFFGLWNGGASWSISVEAFCYVVLPIILPFLVKLTSNQLKALAAICFVLAALPGVVLKFFDSPSPVTFYSMPIFRLPEFILGCLICIAWSQGRFKQFSTTTVVASLLALAAYLSFAGARLPMYVGHNWIAIPVIALTIYMLAGAKGAVASIMSGRVAVWLGKVSYSFYSFQVFVLMLLREFGKDLVAAVPALESNLLLAFFSFAALLAMSAAGYYLIEEPARRWIRRRLSSKTTPGGIRSTAPRPTP